VSESGIPPGYGPCYENPGPIYVDVGEGDEVEMVTVEEAERRGLGESIDMFKAMNDPVRDAAERVLNLHPSRRDSLWEDSNSGEGLPRRPCRTVPARRGVPAAGGSIV
jgi:hypothetical protein